MSQANPALTKQIHKEHGLREFFYKAERQTMLAHEARPVVSAVDVYSGEYGLGNPSNIEVLSPKELNCSAEAVFFRYYQLFEGLGATEPEVLFSAWACPHVDPHFKGKAFVSLVLETGDSSYTVSSLSIKKPRNSDIEVQNNAYELCVGDVLVFDPLIPHWAFPKQPAENSLLVILQCTVPFETLEQQHALYQRFPPMKGLRRDGFD